ncbi:HsdR family type I site-specific deoxyribonuclease [uncultured Thiodictyon sp.]|jgi:type I site-specific restriction-modification system R (restriction) subunit|uniref:type I restriction endonuclease subunit R n=1 Tax=uncultured Thiodictyon sp. TaxID=1846217 RepID=UPI0025DFFF2F|nr:HsdR family type I site-specific deoxyribonuclease [uncultured Thiodictyon sp.]
MPNFISEDEIEAAMLQHLQLLYGYDALICFTADPADLNDGSGRTDKREVILYDRLRAAVIDLNRDLPESAIDDAIRQLCDKREPQSAIAANRAFDDLIRNGVQVEFKDAQGRTRTERVKIIDFANPAANQFLAVSQLWILGERGYRRPDLLLYVNGLPLVFIELKNSNVKLRCAYDDNLTNYRAEIPQLFLTNAFCVFSNAIETRVGSLTAEWEHFFHWLRPEDEKEKVRREQVAAAGTSAERFLAGLCPKDRLLDYIENFILYHKDTQKIIAQNHQFIGVNRAYETFLHREGRGGRLGVYWHTQGSGKSFSMIFYVRKILRKCRGNFSFLVVTDRDDLDGQIYRNFLNTGTVRQADTAQPKDSEQLRAFLGQNKRLVFTLIQKFRWPKGRPYPLLSARDDIVVIIDEAHRTQYESLAENMRAGLPKAQYIAFTGTPLLGRARKTNEWFGDYVSEFTAVTMYDKVQRLWKEEIKALRGRLKQTPDELLAARLKRMVDYMRRVEMAVVVSAENGEEEKFDQQGLDIRPHRKRMDQVDANGHDLEYNFKDPQDPLQLVFVCAMWLTGFDAPTVSTLYLDKPQQGHTLMQTIARANRVCAYRIGGVEKKNGEIVDYYGVFGRLKMALKDYGEGGEGEGAASVKDKTEIFRLLDEAIEQGRAFCASINIPIDKALEGRDVFQKIGLFADWANALLYKDEYRKSFSVYENTITGLYEAAKPEVLGQPVVRTVAVFQYLRGVVDSIIQQQDVDSAVRRIGELLDESVVVDDAGYTQAKESGPAFMIRQQGKSWDLSTIDFDKLREEFGKTAYKNIEIADLRAFLEQKLADMMKQNRTRRDFAQRLQAIIDTYNAGSTSADADYAALLRFTQALREEEERHVRMGLTEDELELYDLLCKDKMTKDEEQRVRLAAKALLRRLTGEAPRVLVQDWFKDSQTRLAVRDEVGKVLDLHLPDQGYDKDLFTQKRDRVFELTLDLAINHRKWAA